jgi:hypothetical protein
MCISLEVRARHTHIQALQESVLMLITSIFGVLRTPPFPSFNNRCCSSESSMLLPCRAASRLSKWPTAECDGGGLGVMWPRRQQRWGAVNNVSRRQCWLGRGWCDRNGNNSGGPLTTNVSATAVGGGDVTATATTTGGREKPEPARTMIGPGVMWPHVVSRLDMYHTNVLMYRTMVLLARPTKVGR